MLPFRVLALFSLGFYCYGVAILVLERFKIDLPAKFGVASRPGLVAQQAVGKANQLLFTIIVGFLTFKVAQTLDFGYEIVAWSTVATCLYLILENRVFRRILARIAFGGISTEYRLGDVLISDCLVSYASIFTDLALALSITLSNGELDRSSIHPFVQLVASVPIGIRIKQCFHDYKRTKDKLHLANLLKYFVSNVPNALRIQMIDKPQLASVIPYALAVSAIYSLSWDLAVDWKLFICRKRLFPPLAYVVVGIMDTVLRFAWLAHKPTEYRIFGLQLVEVLRRFVWVLFRVEHEPSAQDIELPTLDHVHKD